MAINVVARGALIGGGVGAAIAALRRGGKAQGEDTGSEVVRYAKSIAEGALAGAGVAFVLDRRSRARASALISEHGPTVLQAVGDLAEVARARATEAIDAARPAVAHAVDAVGGAVESARPAVAHAVETAGPALAGAVAAARPTLSHAVDAARPAVSTAVHRATHLRAA